ncbi:hypothetical protein O181_034016 [Austropuccinia psidii MF-1]|uniref:Uncharacterized protein n=1 Tax=Austropuccinia psidii MF-1 TaxID=1389203 RepID=A0A9Q3D5J6_9BASI|nr:hypothetical protein [Austropuccinia psidii MF-1]
MLVGIFKSHQHFCLFNWAKNQILVSHICSFKYCVAFQQAHGDPSQLHPPLYFKFPLSTDADTPLYHFTDVTIPFSVSGASSESPACKEASLSTEESFNCSLPEKAPTPDDPCHVLFVPPPLPPPSTALLIKEIL